MCQFTTSGMQEDCLSANHPVLDTINQLHDSIPINHVLDIDVITVATVPAADVVCFGDNCPPPPEAPPPAAPPAAPPPAAPTQADPDTGAAPSASTNALGPARDPEGLVPNSAVPKDTTSDPDPPVTLEPGSGQTLTATDIQVKSRAFLASCSMVVAATLVPMVLL